MGVGELCLHPEGGLLSLHRCWLVLAFSSSSPFLITIDSTVIICHIPHHHQGGDDSQGAWLLLLPTVGTGVKLTDLEPTSPYFHLCPSNS